MTDTPPPDWGVTRKPRAYGEPGASGESDVAKRWMSKTLKQRERFIREFLRRDARGEPLYAFERVTGWRYWWWRLRRLVWRKAKYPKKKRKKAAWEGCYGKNPTWIVSVNMPEEKPSKHVVLRVKVPVLSGITSHDVKSEVQAALAARGMTSAKVEEWNVTTTLTPGWKPTND
mgnify:CR=1 FL=1